MDRYDNKTFMGLMHKHFLMRDFLLIHIYLVNYCGLGTNKS
jgi:hypothetical protein